MKHRKFRTANQRRSYHSKFVPKPVYEDITFEDQYGKSHTVHARVIPDGLQRAMQIYNVEIDTVEYRRLERTYYTDVQFRREMDTGVTQVLALLMKNGMAS